MELPSPFWGFGVGLRLGSWGSRPRLHAAAPLEPKSRWRVSCRAGVREMCVRRCHFRGGHRSISRQDRTDKPIVRRTLSVRIRVEAARLIGGKGHNSFN